jgi:type I phosphodiesterase/nucleotide pyrophosphatase
MMNKSIDLFIFSDALGWELARERNFLADLLPHRAPCGTIFGYSSSCDPSILTGRLPFEHGHFSFFVYDPPRSPFGWAKALAWLPDDIAGHHRLRNVLSRWCVRAMGYTGYFQLYGTPFSKLPFLDYTEKKDIYEPGGINGGQEAIFEVWNRLGVPWIRSDWRAGDAANIAAMKQALEEGKIRCAYLFTGGLDAAMHAGTTHGAEADRAFGRLEQWLKEIHAVASKKYREVRLHLFSDHGMTDTTDTSDMMFRFEELGLKYGEDYGAVWDSTMARFWFLDSQAREKIMGWLSAQPEGKILSDEQLRDWGCLFEDRRYGEIFFLLKPGVLFAPCYMARHRVPAMHGFDPAHPSSAACWLTSHPMEAPARIEGIFEVMKKAAYLARGEAV